MSQDGLFAIKKQVVSPIRIDLSNVETFLASIDSILNITDFSTETTLSNIDTNIDTIKDVDFATESTLSDIDSNIGDIKTNTGNTGALYNLVNTIFHPQTEDDDVDPGTTVMANTFSRLYVFDGSKWIRSRDIYDKLDNIDFATETTLSEIDFATETTLSDIKDLLDEDIDDDAITGGATHLIVINKGYVWDDDNTKWIRQTGNSSGNLSVSADPSIGLGLGGLISGATGAIAGLALGASDDNAIVAALADGDNDYLDINSDGSLNVIITDGNDELAINASGEAAVREYYAGQYLSDIKTALDTIQLAIENNYGRIYQATTNLANSTTWTALNAVINSTHDCIMTQFSIRLDDSSDISGGAVVIRILNDTDSEYVWETTFRCDEVGNNRRIAKTWMTHVVLDENKTHKILINQYSGIDIDNVRIAATYEILGDT